MAAMLNRFAPPETGPAEPKQPAWKTANANAAMARKNSERSISVTATPPPAPAPTPAASRTTTPYDNVRSGSNSRPDTDTSGAYSDTDDGGISRGDPASDTDYESTGMTDIPSGYDDTDLSDDNDSIRPSSAPPTSTLFGVSMKKALSRPADRVEQAERKAERLEQAEIRRGTDNHIFLSDSELSVSASGMSGNEADRRTRSRHLSSLERIIANSDNRAQAKERVRNEEPPTLSTFDEENMTPKDHRDTAERGRDLIGKLLGQRMKQPPVTSPQNQSSPPEPIKQKSESERVVVEPVSSAKPPTPPPLPDEAGSPTAEQKTASGLSQEKLKLFGGGKIGKFKMAALVVKKAKEEERKSLERPKNPEPEPEEPEPEPEVETLVVPPAPVPKVVPVAPSISPAMSLRVDIDRLSTQRITAGLKPEKHGSVEVCLLKNGEELASEKRFLSVSAGGLYMATYFTLLECDGYVETTSQKLSGTSEKLCDLTKCSIEVKQSSLSLCGFTISVLLNRDNARGVVLKPNRLGDLLEWGSVIQQCVDLLTVASKVGGALSPNLTTKRDARGRVFRLPGQTDEVDTNSSRSKAAEHSIWRVNLAKEDKDRLAATERFEARATKAGVIPSGIDASNQLMSHLYDATKRKDNQQSYSEMLVNPLPVSSKGKVFHMHEETDPLLQQVLKLRSSDGPRLPNPPPQNRQDQPTPQPGYSLLDSTKGTRLGANPSNAPYLNNATKRGASYSSGFDWLDGYRDMVRELDEMEFSTSRTLGYLNESNKYYKGADTASSLYSKTIPPNGGVVNATRGVLPSQRGTPSSSSLYSGDPSARVSYQLPGPLLTPGATVPMLYNLNMKDFTPPAMNPYAY